MNDISEETKYIAITQSDDHNEQCMVDELRDIMDVKTFLINNFSYKDRITLYKVEKVNFSIEEEVHFNIKMGV
jgi:hypothetical protein